jgi:hypothetical protein
MLQFFSGGLESNESVAFLAQSIDLVLQVLGRIETSLKLG